MYKTHDGVCNLVLTDNSACMVPSKPESSGVESTASENKLLFGAPRNGKDPAPMNTGLMNAIQFTPPIFLWTTIEPRFVCDHFRKKTNLCQTTTYDTITCTRGSNQLCYLAIHIPVA